MQTRQQMPQPGPAKEASTPAPAGRIIDIPEGTPVLFHIYGSAGVSAYTAASMERSNRRVIQVDQDVAVGNAVVVPRGSLGMAHADGLENGKYKWHGYKKRGQVRLFFHVIYVFSVASTKLDLDPERMVVDEAHQNGEIVDYGVRFLIDSQFTAKLKHATIALP